MDEGLAGLAAGYGFAEPAVALGRAVKGEEVATGFEVAAPLAMIQMGKLALRFRNTPAGHEIQRSLFGVLRKRR